MTLSAAGIRSHSTWRILLAAFALLLLNASLTFANVWPTLGVHWRGELSVELAALLAVLAAVHAGGRPIGRGWLPVLALGGLFLAIGRYFDVTSPALYGRPVNLYWDLPHVSEVTGMLSRVASPGMLLAFALAAVVSLTALYLVMRWSIGQVDQALQHDRRVRVGLGVAGAVLVACFLVQQLTNGEPPLPRFSIPVSQTYGVQVARVAAVLSGHDTRNLPPSPALQSSLGALQGQDVLLIFMESYGRTTYQQPEYAGFLQPSRERLAAAIQDTGRSVVSAFMTSPTFGGTSVLAHLSLLTGIQVRDTRSYQLLMTQQRPTLVSVFRQAGYRTVAFMPGNQHPWPEGSFYGFDHIYDAAQLDYRGPQFGWWHIPDQFSLAALDADELRPEPRKPLFVFFPTLSTHMPFRPTPPVQADWSRMLSAQPYDAAPLQASMARTPQWTHLGESYIGSVQYFFDSFASWLRLNSQEHCVVIILGDHQPASSVSGEGASWDVPVHVITSQPDVLRALRADGFQPGLTPGQATVGNMNQLAQWLLAAFNAPQNPAESKGTPETVQRLPGLP